MLRLRNILYTIGKYGNEFNLVNPMKYYKANNIVEKDINRLVIKYRENNEKYNTILEDGTIVGRFNVIEG